MIAELRQLWLESFEDTDAFLDGFFATGYSPDRCHCLTEDGKIVSALYWFDCSLDGHKLAYLYGVATAKEHRGKGFARCLLEQTHEILKEKGYAGAILVPGTAELFSFYKKLGYRDATQIREFTCVQGRDPVSLREIDTQAYADLRKQYLPAGGVVQEGAALSFLHTYTKFYDGGDFLLAAGEEKGTLLVQELLGNTGVAAGILRSLNVPEGRFCIPGEGRPFAMFLSLKSACPLPAYFGLAMD